MHDENAAWWHRPENFLYAWDFSRDCARFLPLDRETLRRSIFLDRRIATDTERARTVPIVDVLAQESGDTSVPHGFIFHTAFCCSTLLARSLDVPGQVLALREPATLLQLADLARGLTPVQYTLEALFRPTLNLISRRFSESEAVVIKPTNLVNNLIGPLLTAHSESRAIILYDDLEPFLLSVLKRPRESEGGIRSFLTRLVRDKPDIGARARPAALPQAAALAWHLQIRQIQDWLISPCASRIRLLRTDQLLARPVAMLAAASQWLQLALGPDQCRAITAGPIWRTHAKQPGRAYAPRHRSEEQLLARRMLGAPLAEATAYARNLGSEGKAAFSADVHLLPESDRSAG